MRMQRIDSDTLREKLSSITATLLNEEAVIARKKKVPFELKGHRKADYTFTMSVCGVAGKHAISVYVLKESDDIILFGNTMFERNIGLSQSDVDLMAGEMRRNGTPENVIKAKIHDGELSLDHARWIRDLKKRKPDAGLNTTFATYTDSWGPIIQKRPCYIKIHGILSQYGDLHPNGGQGKTTMLYDLPNNWRQEFVVRLYNLLTEISRKYWFFFSLALYPDTDAESAEYMRLCDFVVGVCDDVVTEKHRKILADRLARKCDEISENAKHVYSIIKDCIWHGDVHKQTYTCTIEGTEFQYMVGNPFFREHEKYAKEDEVEILPELVKDEAYNDLREETITPKFLSERHEIPEKYLFRKEVYRLNMKVELALKQKELF